MVSGAEIMIKEGCLDGVDEIYGMHNFPFPLEEIHCIPGLIMAEFIHIKITIIGKGGHGSDPSLSNNPITPSTRIYLRYLELIDEFKSKGHTFNSTLAMFNAGTAMNVVPDESLLQGTFRSLEEGLVNIFMD